MRCEGLVGTAVKGRPSNDEDNMEEGFERGQAKVNQRYRGIGICERQENGTAKKVQSNLQSQRQQLDHMGEAPRNDAFQP